MNLSARRLWLALMLTCTAGTVQAQCVTINAVDVPQVQDFDALATTGTANVLALPGWSLVETGTSARVNDLYAADNGAGTAGDTLSLGTAGASDRALGSLRSGTIAMMYGACYTNNTGAAIEGLDIAYTGEQWRLGTLNRADTLRFEYSLDATDLATGTWTGLAALDFTSPATTGATGARDGNAAEFRAARSGFIGDLAMASGATVWVRWSDLDATGADDALAVDDFALTARGAGGGGNPVLSIAGNSAAEGDSGTTPFFFSVSLDRPAGPGGVSFDYATANGTAIAGGDYVAEAANATIAEGASSVTLTIDVLGDTAQEPNETFFVDVSNVVGAAAGTLRATGTINNDDVVVTAIHDVQGAGATSPLVGASVTVRGVVTGRKTAGFFVQAAESEYDADDATSEGVYVFTGSAPPAAVAVGNRVQATGTVLEYIPTADPGQLPLTELGGTVEVVLLSTMLALPAPMVLTTALPSPTGALDQLERYEGMRVTAPSFTVVAPTGGSTSEPNATGSSNGIFNVVVTGTPRPFREPGIQDPDQPPSGSIPPIPRWDFNPELLTVTSRTLGGPALDVAAGAQLANLVGPLDYGFRRYTVLPDPAQTVVVSPAPAPQPARLPTPDEFTVASYNVERFFDTANDPATDDPVLTPAAFAARLNKASLAIRDFLHAPDVLGLVEVENLVALQALAAKVNDDAVAAGQPDPGYIAILSEGNDVGGIDVGFLVKTREVAAGTPRVEIDAVTQLGADTTWTEPGGGTSLLNDRPPLQLDATVHFEDDRSFPLTAIVVHQRSLSGAEADDANGERVRAKRQRQAEFLAGEIDALQADDPQRRITVLGDFNAFAFNDGYVDAMNVVTGTPTPDEQTVVAGDGVDLVDPDLRNLHTEEPEDQRYSFVFDGNAQSLDHVLVNPALELAADDVGLDHARINADFPEIARNDANSPSRLSDHDPAMMYVRLDALAFADLAVVATADVAPTPVGGPLAFTVVLDNEGPDAAGFPGIGFALDIAAADMAVTAPAGWTCDAAQVVAQTTTVACTTATLANAGSATFAVAAAAPASSVGDVVTLTAAATSQTQDPEADNNSDSAATQVESQADLQVSVAGPSTIARNASASWTVLVGNAGPSPALQAEVELAVRVATANVALTTPQGWTCERTVRGNFGAICTANAALAVGAPAPFLITVAATGRMFSPRFEVVAAASSTTEEADPVDNADSIAVRLVRP